MFHWGDRGEPNLIIEGLYLGNGRHGSSSSLLESLGVTRVVNVTPYLSRNMPKQVDVLHVDIHDHPAVDISAHFDRVFEFIDAGVSDCRQRVLVHCEMGMSRSSTMVIMYLMRALRMPLRDALCFTRLRRPITNPNNGFMRHLSELELRLFGTQSVDVALFQDSFGSGAMGVEIPPHWNPQAPPAFSHPHREPHQSNEHLPAVAEAMSSVQDAV
eukprot:TRINITY_DN306_c0_g1_i4.p1 TRINITY_DN306_c0_g1~~TRINITY_DN306_c0_g1_i4.p1  ORF type:complete len:214 (-),score=21.09 TRINITY_DN306_c0_g1_i4:311-952(-)